MGISLEQIVPWGRSFAEYERMFALGPADFAGAILDCGGGPSSFTAELAARAVRVFSIDPLYLHSREEIRSRFESVIEPMLAQVRASPADWVWTYHRNPEELGRTRRAAVEQFLADYENEGQPLRYLAGQLPSLPLRDQCCGLAVCSHLLFLYSDLLSEDFHLRAIRELCRVAREVRFFPLVTLAGQPSPHVASVCAVAEADGWKTRVERVNYELQRGGNQMLRVFRPAPR